MSRAFTFRTSDCPSETTDSNAQAGVCEHFAQSVARLAGGHDVIHEDDVPISGSRVSASPIGS